MRNRPLARLRRRVLALVGSAALAVTAAVALPGTAHAANVLGNPGFESGGLSPWSCTGNLGSVVSSPVHGGIHDNLIRVSVGIEDLADLKADLEQALK